MWNFPFVTLCWDLKILDFETLQSLDFQIRNTQLALVISNKSRRMHRSSGFVVAAVMEDMEFTLTKSSLPDLPVFPKRVKFSVF
jgi:hypothetical protein